MRFYAAITKATKPRRPREIHRRIVPQLDDDQIRFGVETSKIFGVRRHDPRAVCTCAEHDRCVDDVGGTGHAAELARCTRFPIVQWLDHELTDAK